MKYIIFIILLLVLVFPLVSAENLTNTTQPELISPGTTPDSMFYFMDLFMDNLAIAFTFDDQEKIEKELEIAEERLSEARKMALEGNIDAMIKAEEKHGDTLLRIKAKIKDLGEDNQTEKLKLQLKVKDEVMKYEMKIKGVQDELKVKIKIKGEITPEQQEMIDSILSNLEGQRGEIEIEIDNEKGKTKIKIKEETGEDSDEVEKRLRIELKDEDDDFDENDSEGIDKEDEKEIEVKVKDGVARIKYKINERKEEFNLEEVNKERIIQEISVRTGLSIEEIRDFIEFDEEEIDKEDDDGLNDGQDENESDRDDKEDEDKSGKDDDEEDDDSDDDNSDRE